MGIDIEDADVLTALGGFLKRRYADKQQVGGSVSFIPALDHKIYARIKSHKAAYAQSLDVHTSALEGTNAILKFGGDGDQGKKPTPWNLLAMHNAPVRYWFDQRSWYQGRSKRNSGVALSCDIYEKGVWIVFGFDDYGRWAHDDPNPDYDYNEYVFDFVICVDKQCEFVCGLLGDFGGLSVSLATE